MQSHKLGHKPFISTLVFISIYFYSCFTSKHQALPLIKAEIPEVCLPRTQKTRANTLQGLLQGHLFTLNIQQNNGKSCSRNGVVLKKSVLKRILKNQRVWSAGFSWKRGWVKNTSGLGLFRALLMMLGFLFSHQEWDTQSAEKNWWEHPARKKTGKKGRKKMISINFCVLPPHPHKASVSSRSH